ncbi:MAG: EMC3/TMCO1 family protein [Candidatus Bathyarchaeia archaeon]
MFPNFAEIPWSTLSVIGIAFLVSLMTTLVNRKFIDREQFAKWREEINAWNVDKNKAKQTGDKKLMAKVKKQELHILQLQSRMAKQQMKVFAVTFVPILVMWQILPGFYGFASVAYIPIMGVFPLSFFLWYLICSFFTSTILSRLFGVEIGMGTGMQPQPETTKK